MDKIMTMSQWNIHGVLDFCGNSNSELSHMDRAATRSRSCYIIIFGGCTILQTENSIDYTKAEFIAQQIMYNNINYEHDIYQEKEPRLGVEFSKQHRVQDGCIGTHNLAKIQKHKQILAICKANWIWENHCPVSHIRELVDRTNYCLKTQFAKLNGIIVGSLPGPSVSGLLGSVRMSKRAKTFLGNL